MFFYCNDHSSLKSSWYLFNLCTETSQACLVYFVARGMLDVLPILNTMLFLNSMRCTDIGFCKIPHDTRCLTCILSAPCFLEFYIKISDELLVMLSSIDPSKRASQLQTILFQNRPLRSLLNSVHSRVACMTSLRHPPCDTCQRNLYNVESNRLKINHPGSEVQLEVALTILM